MNMDKLTNKSREALLASQNLAVNSGHTELRALHLLGALLSDETGLVPSILEKCGVNRQLFSSKIESALAKLPRLEGSNSHEVVTSREFGMVLNRAMSCAQEMKDEYVSVEHLLMGIIESRTPNLPRVSFGISTRLLLIPGLPLTGLSSSTSIQEK